MLVCGCSSPLRLAKILGATIQLMATMSTPGATSQSLQSKASQEEFPENYGATGALAKPRWRQIVLHPDAACLAFGVLIGIGVCWPMLGGKPLFLLDWVIGPHPQLPSPAMLGLNGGLTAGLLGNVVMTLLIRSIGEAATWLVLFWIFPIAAIGVGRLTGGWIWARLAASALYCVNPWIFNRIYAGDLDLLLGYALLPFAVSSALRVTKAPHAAWSIQALSPLLWWVTLTALAPHYTWIYGLVLVCVVLVRHPWHWWSLGCLVAWVAGFVVMNSYVLLPHSATELPVRLGTNALAMYQTRAIPHFGLLPTVIALYGFWRAGPGPELPRFVVTGWPLLVLGLLVMIVAGYWAVLRPWGHTRNNGGRKAPADEPVSGFHASGHCVNQGGGNMQDPRRHLAWILAVIGIAGLFLAMGSQGPTGALFTWAYEHVPYFDIMREPQKFLMLTVLAYSVGLGWGIEWISRLNFDSRHSGTMIVAATLGLALPLGYCPTIFDGLAGQIGPSTIPVAYQHADQLMGRGAGRVLYLPWHLYEALPFTKNRVVASLGPTVFHRTVLISGTAQVGAIQSQPTSVEQAYITRLLENPTAIHSFGDDLAHLGVKYVVLVKAVNWRSYLWIAQEPDLDLLLNRPSLEVWQNSAYYGPGSRMGSARHVRQLSLVAYRIPPGRPGVAEIDAAYQPGWVLNGHPGEPSPTGTVEFPVGTRGGVARFEPWGLVKLGDIISASVFAVLAILVAWDRWRHWAD